MLNLPSQESAFFLNRRTVQFGPRKSETFVSDVFWRVGVFLVELFVEFDLLNENVILCVLAVCAFFLTGVIPNGLILRKFCVRCLCKFCFM